MNSINNINFYNLLLRVLIYLNCATILIPDKFKAWPVGLLLLTTVLRRFKLNSKPVLETKKFIISIGFFIVLLLSFSYSNDIYFAFRGLETGASLFVFPLIFYLIGRDQVIFSEKTILTLKLVFIFSVVFFLVSTFWFFYFTEPFYNLTSTLTHYTNLVDIRIQQYEIHPIYLSIHIGIALLLISSIIKKCTTSQKKVLCLALLLLIVFTAILNKKGPIISLVLTGIFYTVNNKFNFKQIIYLFSILIFLSLSIIYLPKYNNVNRFKELINVEYNANTSTGIRIQIYQCAVKKIAQFPVFGYGWGDTKFILNDCYRNKSPNLLKHNYNTHNQFFSILLSTGLIGFFAFVYYIFYIFKVSNKIKFQLFFFYILYICLNMLTENILEREDGVIVITLFINMLLFNFDHKQQLTSDDASH